MSPLSRRRLLSGAAGAAAVGAAAGAGVTAAITGAETSSAAGSSDAGAATGLRSAERPHFAGRHQVGVVDVPREHSLLAAFRCVAEDRAALADMLRALTTEARVLVEGRTTEPDDPWAPPQDTGVLGVGAATGLAVTVSVGASLFDDRYGLADRKPRELVPMPYLSNDRLDPARTHGDILLSLQADRQDGLQHGLRQLMRATRAWLVPHWVLDGYSRPDVRHRPGTTNNRNLMGFKDGSANPHGEDDTLMRKLVWVGAEDDEPAWAVGGSYQAVRVIRMFVEQWDRTPLREQEDIFGRHKVSGAPLGLSDEAAAPDYAGDPRGRRIPLDAHIRMANPRTARDMDRRLLRRGFSFALGADAAGTLDQGLAFVSYQRRLAHFIDVAKRLDGEPLEEYILPVGGGFFFVLPGVDDDDDWLGRSLLA